MLCSNEARDMWARASVSGLQGAAHVLLKEVLRRIGLAVGAQLDHGLVSLLHNGACLRVRNRLRGLLKRG